MQPARSGSGSERQRSSSSSSGTASSSIGHGGSSALQEPLHVALALQSSLPCTAAAPLVRRNLGLLRCFSFLLGLTFLSPLFVLYLRASLHDSATQVSLVLAAHSVAAFVCELPAGVAADLCGRKYCMIACVAMRLAGLLVLGLGGGPHFT